MQALKDPETLPTSAKGLSQNAEILRVPTDLTKRFPRSRYVGEPKLDGWRLLIHRTDESVHVYARSGQRYDGRLPSIEAEVLERFPAGTWLDAEAVALAVEDGKLTQSWASVQSVLTSGGPDIARRSDGISLMVFDLIAYDGLDMRELSYEHRRNALEEVFAEGGWERILLVPQVRVADASLEVLLAQGFEGMMIKDRRAPYRSGKRGEGWWKIKPQDTEDVVIMGFKPGENGFTGLVGSVIFGQYRDGKLQERGRASGMKMPVRKDMTADPQSWIGTVVEIAHMGVMESGSLRHPQMKQRREDKAPTECEWS